MTPKHQFAPGDAARAILEGYRNGLARPKATFVDEGGELLRPYAAPTATHNQKFWQEVDDWPSVQPTESVADLLKMTLPIGAQAIRFASRQKGGGSLGRARVLIVARYNTGRIIREAKAFVPSAWKWARESPLNSQLAEIAIGKFRAPDPTVRLQSGYVLRRVAPDSHKIEFKDLADEGLTTDLLMAMATDLACVHASSPNLALLAQDLDDRSESRKHWLRDATEVAQEWIEDDCRRFNDPDS